MVYKRHVIGKLGEDIACRFLKGKRFDVVERNYRKKWGEIDIVGRKNGTLYFFEVKSVTGKLDVRQVDREHGFRAEDNLHPHKLKRLARTVETYLAERRVAGASWEFVALVVVIDEKQRRARVSMLDNIVLER